MNFRTAFLGASAAMMSAACALILDVPSSVSVADSDGGTDDTTKTEAGPVTDAATPLCDGPILIRGLNATASLAVADVALPLYLGVVDHLREINETGGIRGCKLEWEFVQTAFGDPTSAVSIYEQFKARSEWPKVAAVFGVGSADAIALGPKAQEDKKVLLSVAYNGTLGSPNPKQTPVKVPETSPAFVESTFDSVIETKGYPYVFFGGTDYSTAIRIAMFHVGTLSPGARVGFVHCPANEFCTNPLPAGKTYAVEQGLFVGRSLNAELTDRAAEYGAKVAAYYVAEAAYAAGHADYKPVSWLWAGNLTVGTFFLAAALGQLGATVNTPDPTNIPQPVWDKARALMNATRIIANNYGFDESLPLFCAKLGAGAATCDRIYGIMPLLAFGDTSTGAAEMAKVVALHDKWRKIDENEAYNDASVFVEAGIPVPTTRSVRYVQGYANVKLLRIGIEKVFAAGKRVTGETLKEAFESFRSEDMGGLSAPLSYSADDHRPQSSLSIYQVQRDEDAGTGFLFNASPNRRLSLQGQWLGW